MEKSVTKVGVIGLGYIGLPTAALLASKGYQVHGVDVVPEVVATINEGRVHIVEPDLDERVQVAVKSGKLKASLKPDFCDIFMIAVPTPFYPQSENESYPKPNIEYVLSAAESLIPFLRPGVTVILESTSPVGTTDQIASLFKANNVDISQISIAYCPERVLPGQILRELVENDRVVGGITSEGAKKVAAFYRSFVAGQVFETQARTAELVKLTENSYRDVNIAFANELSMICAKLDVNVWSLIQLANRHPRVNILTPGCGVGGHCIAVDPWFIVDAEPENSKIIQAARRQNLAKTEWCIDKIKSMAADFMTQHGRKPVIACMGLSFKPNVDDLRESPSLEITEKLIGAGYHIVAVEPNIREFKGIELLSLEVALKKGDIFVILVGHRDFVSLDLTNKMYVDFTGSIDGRLGK